MANLYLNIPVPASNGSGAPVNISALGYSKLFSLVGVFAATINIEISNDGVTWVAIASMTTANDVKRLFAAVFVRATVTGVAGGVVLSVGSDNPGTDVTILPVPAGNGTGAPVDVSAFGLQKTLIYDGGMEASLNVEISQDGVTFSQAASFTGRTPASAPVCGAVKFMRVAVGGFSIGVGNISLCAAKPSTGGGGGGGGGFTPQAGPFLAGAPTTRSGVGIFVNPADPTAADDANAATPKLTIQGALDCIPPQATGAIAAQKSWSVFVAPGCYDEDITVPAQGIKLTMFALGNVTLGDGVNPDGSSTTPRSVSWPTSNVGEFGSQSYVAFTTMEPGNNPFIDVFSQPIRPTGWRVSGDMVILASATGGDPPIPGGPAGPHTFWANDFQVDGNMTATTDTATLRFVLRDVTVVGDAICFSGPLGYGENVTIMGSAHFAGCGDVINSRFLGVLTNFEQGSINPDQDKLINCLITQNLTISGGGFISIDPLTNFHLINNSVIVVGGGAKGPFYPQQTVCFWGNTNIGALAATRYLTPGFDTGVASLIDNKQVGPGGAKTAYALEVRHNTPDSSPSIVTYTLLINGVASAITVAVPATSNNQNSVPVAVDIGPGDRLSLQLTLGAALANGGVLDVTVALRGF